MRPPVIAGLSIAAVAWPFSAQAQQSIIPAFQAMPLWAQIALLLVPAFSTAFAALGLLLTFYQLRRANAQLRATLVAECLKEFAQDDDIQRAFYIVEYSKFTYDEEFHESPREREIDKLLIHFSNIGLAWRTGLLNIRDLRPAQYYILTIVNDQEIQKYLEFITEWSKTRKFEHPYAVLNELAHQLRKSSPKLAPTGGCPHQARA
jgi:hypothetical protein